jgi:hypothetical protein
MAGVLWWGEVLVCVAPGQRRLKPNGYYMWIRSNSIISTVIASEAKQSRAVSPIPIGKAGLLRRFAPRNDDKIEPLSF